MSADELKNHESRIRLTYSKYDEVIDNKMKNETNIDECTNILTQIFSTVTVDKKNRML